MNRIENIYLDNIDLEDAIEKYSKHFVKNNHKDEIVLLDSALGRILSEPIYAQVSNPNFNASAMDGIAVNFCKTTLAKENCPVRLRKGIDFEYVDTGDVIKEYDSVIMIEDVTVIDNEYVEIIKPTYMWQNIRPIGEDITKTQMVLPSGSKITGRNIGSIAAAGISKVKVYRPWSVGIIPTGTEIVNITDNLEVGNIIDSNSYMLKACSEELGFVAKVYDTVKDDRQLLKEAFIKAIEENDIVFSIAGSSAGSEDFTKTIFDELGEVIVHGMNIKPGKPAILAKVNDTMCIGMPGYPVSAYMIFEQVFKRVMSKFIPIKQDKIIKAYLTKTIYSSAKHKEFVRVRLGFINGNWRVTPLSRGAGATMSIAQMDGILVVEKGLEGYEKGSCVDVITNVDEKILKNKISCVGSHDIIIDQLTELSNLVISSNHTGSMGGVMSLKSNECHFAPIHILDEKTGQYNIDIVKKFFKDEKMALIKVVRRSQGIVVSSDMKDEIRSIKDIVGKRFINRQKGSGTAILFDSLLKSNGISKEDIIGYDLIAPTHFGVASAVKNKSVDCGIAIKSVAKSLNLNFHHLGYEEYDFLVYQKDLETDYIKEIIRTIRNSEFEKTLEKLDGYEANGDVILIE